jgi:hypothetical protein
MREIGSEIRGLASEIERMDLGNQRVADQIASSAHELESWSHDVARQEGLE